MYQGQNSACGMALDPRPENVLFCLSAPWELTKETIDVPLGCLQGGVGATATRLVQASNCSWVVSVGIDGDDAVTPFFVHDPHREISRAQPAAVRAVLPIHR